MPAREGRGATLFDFSDTDLLALVEDLYDAEGWSSTKTIAAQLGFTGELEITGHRSVGVRLSQMRWRYGWLEKHPDEAGKWKLSEMGHLVLDGGELQTSMRNALFRMTPAQRVRAIRSLGETTAAGPDAVRHAMRREWNRNLGIR